MADQNYVEGYGDLSNPRAALDYKIHMGTRYYRLLLTLDPTRSRLARIIQNNYLLREQQAALLAGAVSLTPPTQAEIDSIKIVGDQVEGLTNTQASLNAGLMLMDQVAAATMPLLPVS